MTSPGSDKMAVSVTGPHAVNELCGPVTPGSDQQDKMLIYYVTKDHVQ